MTNKLQAYTFGRLVAVVESAVDGIPEQFAVKFIANPSKIVPWLSQAAQTEGEHQRLLMGIIDNLDPDWAFPTSLIPVQQSDAWVGYHKQRATDTRFKLGQRIAALRKDRGLTLRQLAELCEVNYSNIAKIEQGKYNVSIDIISRITTALNADLTIG